jgi:hypothetical protein
MITLAERIFLSRADRPDEWSMDDYSREAKKLESKVAELEKELETAMTFNVDVVRCLSRIASVENHNEVPAYIDMSRRCIKAIEAKQDKTLKEQK